jgi:D-3-phosphoglycerate dehydrogenase / 2-oxoglutarate reductase
VTPQVLVTDAGAVLAAVVSHLEDEGVAVTVMEPGATAEDAALAADGVPVVIVGLLPFGAAAIGRLRGTGLLIRAGIGYDIIDVPAASAAGIWVANVPDFCVDEVADHTMLLLAAAMRRLPAALASWREAGRWAVIPQLPPMHRMRGKRLGLIGLGRIGRQVAVRARGFGLDVVAHDPFVGSATQAVDGVTLVGLRELLMTSDAVSLHCPLTDGTDHLVDAAFLDQLRHGAIVINTSRGGLVDLDALYAAVSTGRVSVAALDVVDGEPTPDLDHPLLHHDNVIVTPHVAWYSSDAQAELARNTADEALRHLRGERPRNLINPEARQAEVTAATKASTSATEL